MDGLEKLLRLLIEKSWAVGVLLVVTCGLALLAQAHGAKLPPVVEEWAFTGMLGGAALIAVSTLNSVGALIFSLGVVLITNVMVDRRNRKRSAATTILNLQTLTPDEMQTLYDLLRSGNMRFEIHLASAAYGLVRKGALVRVQDSAAMMVLCELHPVLMKIKASLIPDLEMRLRVEPQKLPDPQSWMAR